MNNHKRLFISFLTFIGFVVVFSCNEPKYLSGKWEILSLTPVLENPTDSLSLVEVAALSKIEKKSEPKFIVIRDNRIMMFNHKNDTLIESEFEIKNRKQKNYSILIGSENGTIELTDDIVWLIVNNGKYRLKKLD